MTAVSDPQSSPPKSSQFEDRVLLGFVVAASLAMAWITWPFFGAILWALVVTIAFWPVRAKLMARMPHRQNTVATIMLLMVIALVIVPVFFVGSLLVEEAVKTYSLLQNQEIDLGKIIANVESAIPAGWQAYIDRYISADIQGLQEKLSSILTGGLQLIASQAVSVGQRAFNFALAMGVMLYLSFFLLRDGGELTGRIGRLVPMRPEQRSALFEKFTTVVRATVKGSIVVAIVQGFLGGGIFAILGLHSPVLWGVVMGLLALIPAVGTGLVWLPFALYLLVTGSFWTGLILLLFGVFVISMVDNVLRPILVGQDTRMPDYVVLISTLGGLSVMGINGLIVGPVIAAMFIASWEIFGEARNGALVSAPPTD